MDGGKLLLIVDPQIDFISGSLPVPGARAAMDALAAYIAGNASDYCAVAVTVDWHPFGHLSFVEEGGQWPRHCVAFSEGASVYSPVLLSACAHCAVVRVFTKGTIADREEYSVFQNLSSSAELRGMIADMGVSRIDVCGLAGDVCVKNTADDAVSIYGAGMVRVLHEFSPTIA